MICHLIISSKRPIPGDIELWDIIDRREFRSPDSMKCYLDGQLFLRRDSLFFKNIKVELYRCSKYGIRKLGSKYKPMLIKHTIPPGDKYNRFCIQYQNGNIQDIRYFLNHWKLLTPQRFQS